jgi:hypothetical protein
MSLKDRIRAIKRGEDSSDLSRIVRSYLVSRPQDFREDGWHISDICMMCARARALKMFGVPAMFSNDPVTEKLYDLGKGIHLIYQNWYFGGANVLWGKWECLRCSKVIWGFKPASFIDGVGCYHDGKGHRWSYQEIPIRVKAEERLKFYEWAQPGLAEGIFKDVVGSSDALVWEDSKKHWVCADIKTCRDEIFKFQYKKAAFEPHRRQANLYAYLIKRGYVDGCSREDIPSPEEVSVFYVNRNTSDEIEHSFNIDEGLVQASFDELTKFDRYTVTGELPERCALCDTKEAKRAKKCGQRIACFSRE